NLIFQTVGAGSRLDLSHVITWRGAGSANNGSQIVVQAVDGGVADLSQVPQIIAGNTGFRALDAGQINLAALGTFTGAVPGGNYNFLEARRGGAGISAPNLGLLTNVDLSLGGDARLPVGNLNTFIHGNLSAFNDGGASGVLTLPVTAIDETAAN